MKNWKNKLIALLAGTSALAFGGALVCMGNAPVAHAAEGDVYAFYNVGANDDAKAMDEALGLTETDNVTASTAGTVTAGSTLFTSYAENATYTVTLDGSSHKIAVAVKAGASVTIGGESVSSPADEDAVVTKVVTGASVEVAVMGKLCGILVDDEDASTLMAVTYTEGQIIPYGALLADVLENATGYYSDGTVDEVAIEYGDINAATGVNVNFTTIDVTGTIAGTEIAVSRHLTTMPDDLVYFINSGSYNVDGKYGPGTADTYFDYNQMVFDYYGESLKNYGTPDKSTTSGSNEWGYYTKATYTAPGDATFPYNSLLWTDEAIDMGYYLTNLDQGEYRIWIGTLSHWHARTVGITFNGQTVGADNLRINSSKGFTVYEGVKPDASGKIDLHMQGASTNEPCINFIAVQKMETEIVAAPSSLVGANTVGMEDTSLTVTGVKAGAKLQLYNAAKPNQVLYEEVAPEDIDATEEYVIDWGYVIEGISQFNVVQITNGGVSGALLVSITDIEGFEYSISPESYTTGSVTVTVKAHADSGIARWSYQLGEYGVVHAFDLEKPYAIEESFTALENGSYIVVITSGLGVTYSETVEVTNIDPDSPVISIIPAVGGWEKGAYHVTLSVTSIAPVAEYKLFKEGKLLAQTNDAPSTIKFTETGEYIVSVKTAAGQTSLASVRVSDEPSTTNVTSVYARRTLTYTFGNTDDYTIASVSAYQVTGSGVTRMTIASGNSMDVYSAGTYVVTITTANGTVEMFALNVTAKDLGGNSGGSGLSPELALGLGLGIGAGGIVIATVAVVVVLVLRKKKS